MRRLSRALAVCVVCALAYGGFALAGSCDCVRVGVCARFVAALSSLGHQREAEDGHEVASHSYTHPDLTRLSPTALIKEVLDTENLLASVTCHRTKVAGRRGVGGGGSLS